MGVKLSEGEGGVWLVVGKRFIIMILILVEEVRISYQTEES